MKIPSTIKIGGYNYNIERVDEAFVCDGDVCHGSHNFSDLKLRVSNVGCSEYQDTVFVHELTHGIIAVYCANQKDEEFVEQFSKGLYQVIIDNPEIFKK